MFKMLIVDDEVFIRKGLRTCIDWNSLNVEITGESKNGVEALSAIDRFDVDFIITDVRMPLMDGLELAKTIKNRALNVKVIMLSGYDEFEYAKKALKYGVYEYLLKPVSIQELTDAVKRLSNQILKERSKVEDENVIESLINENLPSMRSTFFYKSPQILKGNDEETMQKAKKLGFHLNERGYQIALIDIDDYYALIEGLDDVDIGSVKLSIVNMAEEIIGEVYKCTSFYSNADYIICILYVSIKDQYLVNDLLKEVQFCIKKYLRFTVTIGLGNIYDTVGDIMDSYQQAYQALKSKAFLGKDKIIPYASVAKEISTENTWKIEDIQSVSKDTTALIDALFKSEIENTNRILNDILITLTERSHDFDNVKYEVIKVLGVILFNVEKSAVQLDERFNSIAHLYEEIKRNETVEDLERWMKRLIHELHKLLVRSRKDSNKGIIRKAINYASDNYKDSIMLDDIASYIYISSNYFSRIFKEEMGESFVTWLNKYRVKKAQELLETGNLKIYEVAEQVGFNDYRYFNKLFKRYSGCTPIDYRKNL